MTEIVPVPVPSEPFGGTSCEPESVTCVVQVGETVGVAVAVAVFVEVLVGVFVAVFVGVCDWPPGMVTLPLVIDAAGVPSLNMNPGWGLFCGSV